MLSQQNIYPPKNWQDFELLCLKLWGEMWRVTDEIDFNSDNSSGQDGVDIYCIPAYEKEYYGIQCKNKNLFLKTGTKNKLTKSIIDSEIEKALRFKPALKKLVIATSTGKDKKIEEYIREINIKHLNSNLFNVQICFWDYISRKIFEYENVYNWYLKNENFSKKKAISITFSNNKTEIIHEPLFIKTKIIYRLQTEEERAEEQEYFFQTMEGILAENNNNIIDKILSTFRKHSIKSGSYKNDVRILINGQNINSSEFIENTYPRQKNDYKARFSVSSPFLISDKQKCKFQITIYNSGDSVIEDYKLHFSVIGNYEDVEVKIPRLSELSIYKPTTWITGNRGLIIPNENFIVQQDSFQSKGILITPKINCKETIFFKWKLLSRNFNDTGQLKITIIPKYIEMEKVMFVLKKEDCREDFEYSHNHIEGNIRMNI